MKEVIHNSANSNPADATLSKRESALLLGALFALAASLASFTTL
jgi:hypothetical protein